MPSYQSNDLVKWARERKEITRTDIQDHLYVGGTEESSIPSEQTISRTERGKQDIKTNNVNTLMGALEIPIDSFFCPGAAYQTEEYLQLRNALAYCTTYAKEDSVFLEKGLNILNQMKASPGYCINRQELIKHEVLLLEAQGRPPKEIRQLVNKGLAITYPELAKNPFKGGMLVLDEAPLLHSLATTYLSEGDVPNAISILHNIFNGLNRLPQDNKSKERMLAPMLLTLAKCHMQKNDYAEALEICKAGREITIKRNYGFYAPDFAELEIHCLKSTGAKDELPKLTLQALAGYLLQRRYGKADSLLGYAKENKISISTLNMEATRTPMPGPDFAYGKAFACGSIGQLIREMRKDAGLTLDNLSQGLCHGSTLHKLESKRLPLDKVFLLECLMQRLGRYADHYFSTFPKREDFSSKQIRDEVSFLINNKEYDKAKVLVEELAQKESFTAGFNLQFAELSKVKLDIGEKGYKPQHIAMLRAIIEITHKNFEFGLIPKTCFTYNELSAINQIALCLCNSNNNMAKGLRTFEDVLESMDSHYVDEHEKIRMYTVILYNYTLFLAKAGRYEESIAAASIADELDVKHQRLTRLASHAANKAFGMYSLGEKEKCLPYLALAFYGSGLMGRHDNAARIGDYTLKHFGVDF